MLKNLQLFGVELHLQHRLIPASVTGLLGAGCCSRELKVEHRQTWSAVLAGATAWRSSASIHVQVDGKTVG
jgi:hypothetical protein